MSTKRLSLTILLRVWKSRFRSNLLKFKIVASYYQNGVNIFKSRESHLKTSLLHRSSTNGFYKILTALLFQVSHSKASKLLSSSNMFAFNYFHVLEKVANLVLKLTLTFRTKPWDLFSMISTSNYLMNRPSNPI